jgi:3-oxoacyl-[acyl-carrier protein] reductase
MTDSTPRRVALVTGASRGIGRAIAVALGSAGYAVAINYRANTVAAQEATRLVEQSGTRATAIQADVGSPDQRANLVQQTTRELGPIALLVNNAGISVRRRGDLLDVAADDLHAVLATNLEGPFFLTQLVARQMIDQRDSLPDDRTPMIININSISAYAVSIHRAEYCLAKAAMAMMTQLFAARLAGDGILVHEIRPGIIATDMTAGATAKYDRLILEGDLLPIPRWGQPEDVAQTVVAIACGALPYSTGTIIDVDGGFHIPRL